MTEELGHKTLAESHHFHIRFAHGIEIGAAAAAAQGQCGQGVFKYLLKGEKF